MLQPGDAGLFDNQLGQLAHAQLKLLTQGVPLSMNQLASRAYDTLVDFDPSPTKDDLKMANAALRALRSKGFVGEKSKLFIITKTGQDAIERYPDQFLPLFVQRELLNYTDTSFTPVKKGWGNLRERISRRSK
jgi:hypothetical protein